MTKKTQQLRAREMVDAEVSSVGDVEVGGKCGAVLSRVQSKQEGTCGLPAGWNTNHLGFGRCRAHAGNSTFENARGAWMMGHMLAKGKDITPWEALLGEVRRTAGAVAFLDGKVAEANEDDDVRPGGSHYDWVVMRQQERDRLVKVSKTALDAGVAERLVAQVEWEAEALARMLQNILGDSSLALTGQQQDAFRKAARRELMALDAPAEADDQVQTIDGEIA